MNTNEIIKLLVVSGALDVKTGQVDAGKLAGHWTNDGRHGWQRDGGGPGEQEQGSGAARDS